MPVIKVMALLGTLALAGCGDGNGGSSPIGPSGGSGLTGTWMATRAEYVSRMGPAVRVEVVSRGTTMRLTLDAGSSYALTITEAGGPPEVTNGAWSASRDVLTLRPAGMPFSIEFDMSLSGNTLTLTGGSVEFDFNGDTVDEEATLNATLVRQ